MKNTVKKITTMEKVVIVKQNTRTEEERVIFTKDIVLDDTSTDLNSALLKAVLFVKRAPQELEHFRGDVEIDNTNRKDIISFIKNGGCYYSTIINVPDDDDFVLRTNHYVVFK